MRKRGVCKRIAAGFMAAAMVVGCFVGGSMTAKAELTITPNSWESGKKVGDNISITFNASGGEGNITWTTSGTVPTGLTFTGSTTTATLTGTLHKKENVNFTVKATDSTSGTALEKEVTFTGSIDQTKYTISFNENGGTVETAISSIDVDVTDISSTTEVTKDSIPDSTGFKAPTGKKFKHWQVGDDTSKTVAAGGSLTLSSDVTLKAIWEDDPAATVAITKIELSGTQSLTVGGNTTLTATLTPSNTTQTGLTWASSDENVATVDTNGKVTAKAAGKTTITATSTDNSGVKGTLEITVTAASSGSGSNSGSGGSGNTDPSTDDNKDDDNKGSGDSDTTDVPVTVDNNGNATVGEDGQKAIEDAISDDSEETDITIDASGEDADVTAITVPTETMEKIAEAVNDPDNTADTLTVKMTEGAITFDGDALDAIVDQAAGTDLQMNLETVEVTEMNSAQQEAVKDMDVQTVVEAYITSGGERISDFKGGKARITINFTIETGKDKKGFHVWYVADAGTTTSVPRMIDEIGIHFLVEHFSNYVVSYDADKPEEDADITIGTAEEEEPEKPAKKFTDVVAGEWYEDAINWAVANGVTAGISETEFGVGQTLTRGQAVTFITNYASAPLTKPVVKPFSDVDLDRFFSAPVAWAVAHKVVAGYGNGNFGPFDAVTRGQAAVMMRNLVDPTGTGTKDFPDVTAAWQKTATSWAGEKGVVAGYTDSTFRPNEECKREQFVQILYNYETKVKTASSTSGE